MELTKTQVSTILANAPVGADKKKIIEGLIGKGFSLEGFDKQAQAQVQTRTQVAEQAQGNQFEEKPKGFLAGARDFATSIIGGGKLAEGIGMSVASPDVLRQQEEATDLADEARIDLITRIREKSAKGEDTTRLKSQLERVVGQTQIRADVATDFTEELPTNKEVIGSALRLGGTLAGGAIAGKAGQIVGKASPGIVGGAVQGAKVGALAGGVEGGIQGAGVGLEQNQDATGIALSTLGGIAGGTVLGGTVGTLGGALSGKLKANQALKLERKQLLQNNPDSRVAKYTLTGEGQIKTDPIAREAIKQGIDEGTVATIKGASSSDKAKARTALEILVKGKTDKKFGAVNRPSDVVGDSVMQRFKIVAQANKKAGNELDTVAKSLRGKKADPTPAVQSFISDLEDMGVSIKGGKLNYKGSDLEGLEGVQKTVNNVVKRMTEVSDDGYDLHRLKRFIDENVSYGSTGEGLSGRAESVVKRLRSNIDGVLDTTFPEYNNVNTAYSTTRQIIDDFASVAGTKFDPNNPTANAKIGTLARRILSNAQSRTDVLTTLQKLQDIAEQFGGKFDDDIVTQTVFINDLERLFGTSAPTSMAGEVAKGVREATGVLGRLKSGSGILELGLQAGAEGIEKARGINEEGLIKALQELLK